MSHNNDKPAAHSKNDDLLQDYFSEMFSSSGDDTTPVKSTQKAYSNSSQAPRSADLNPQLKTSKRSTVPKATQLFVEPEVNTITSGVIGGLMPKLKAPEQEDSDSSEQKMEPVVEVLSDTATYNDLPEPEPEPEPPQVRVRENSFKNLPEFEALLFDVKGLQLAVPLVSLGSIHRIDSDITPIVGRSSWYLGMLNSNAGNLQVVDTARWVMPSRMQASGIEDYDFVIRLGDTNWALACTSVSHAVRLQQSQVKWRTCNSKRPWLAGTVIDKMCALLDVDSFADLLDENKLHVSE